MPQKTTPADRNGRSVVPLSLALLVFNVLGSGEASRASAQEPLAESRGESCEGSDDPAGPPTVSRRVC